ncbi:GNAT family N-acetyltransferase [Peribacillus sp. SCS-155]|uniref:GNAT family N-acetyltransferase n=1 Tax=Peribacillus sedimenti TaxID=3115297 RepID=UPI0039068EBF
MLTQTQLDDIKQLQHVCEHVEDIHLKLNWDMLTERKPGEKNDFFRYAGDTLIAYIGLYEFGDVVELCGMVHPAYRRKGIFTELFYEAVKDLNRNGNKQVLLNAPSESETAKAFLRSIPCQFKITEYQMKWKGGSHEAFEDIELRTATPDDIEFEISLDVQCFHFDEKGARDFNERVKQQPHQQSYIIEWNEYSVGKLRVDHTTGDAWIYSFAVLPEFQGQGIGRKTLKRILEAESKKGMGVYLDVEAENSHALRLYESCGFKAFAAQDYYTYIYEKS